MAIRLIAILILLIKAAFTATSPIAAQDVDDPVERRSALTEPDKELGNGFHSDETVPDSKADDRHFKFRKYSNIVYAKGDDYRLLCDVYKPVGDGPFPAVLAIHGGAWQHGSKVNMLRHAWKLAAAGYVVVAINYRLAPDYPFPAQVHDCKQAVRWIRSRKEKLNVDPNRIAVFGYSAGGHLAAMLGTTDKTDQLDGEISQEMQPFSSRVQCVVIGGAPCEFSWIKSRALVGWLGESPQENPELYATAAPITYVSKDDPPFIIFHGSADTVVPPESSRELFQKLKSAGIETRYRSVVDKGHLATFTDTSWLDEAIEFMDRKLDGKPHE